MPSGPRNLYQSKLSLWSAVSADLAAREDRFSRIRLALGALAALLGMLSFAARFISGFWILAPIAAFIPIAILHEQTARKRTLAGRASKLYEISIRRLNGDWIGRGNNGATFLETDHPFAKDLDLFGAGSLFELVCRARTSAGERALSDWFLQPAEREECLARQEAVKELTPGNDLREELELTGEEIRPQLHPASLAQWGNAPPVPVPAFGQWLAMILAGLGAVSLLGWAAGLFPLAGFLAVLLLEYGAMFLLHHSVSAIHDALETPARELKLLAAMIGRVERERFSSPCLQAILAAMATNGAPASAEIDRLEALADRLEWAHNQAFGPIAFVLMWVPLHAMAIERWRRRCGPSISRWIQALGEFEALESLACFAFENHQATYPDLAAAGPLFDALGLEHPLIPAGRAVANSLRLDPEKRLLLISGSNMSGKSTLMRAVGLNTILAWAGAPVRAERLTVSQFNLGAAIRTVDSVQEGRSRFYAEITRLRQIMLLTQRQVPVLFLLDELLSGTNSHDRSIGAEAILRGLLDRGAAGLATTHDLALTRIAETLAPVAENVHFEDSLVDGEMHFDYKLRPGIVSRSNALDLMRSIGLEV